MSRRTLRTALMFSILVFFILISTTFLAGTITVFLFQIGVFDEWNGQFPLVMFALASVIVGTVLSKFIGKRPIAKIREISEATKQIAQGNFTVRLNENIRAVEFQEMAKKL